MDVLSSYVELPDRGDLIHRGGPVELQALFVLHSFDALRSEDNEVLPGLFLGAGPDDFRAILDQLADDQDTVRFRMFLGCAGWGPRQLDRELRRQDWMVLPARLEHVFSSDVYSLWERAVDEYQQLNPAIPGGTSNPQWN